MPNPYRLLPPLGPLIGFEAAARLGSFSLAAEELNMTQSAISHQIRTLETHLRQPLFMRVNRGVALTDAGRDLQKTAEAALETVRQGTRRLEAYAKPGSVILQMPPALGSLWFLPRLAAFRAMHPDVDPWLHTVDAAINLDEAEIDIVVTKRAESAGGQIRVPFFRDRRVPLASPAIAERYAGALETAPLLHDESTEDWQKWFQLAGMSRADLAAGPNFSDSAMMIEAAARGLGVCLGSVILAGPMLAEGRLVTMSEATLEEDRPYFLVTSERNLQRPAVRALWDWLNSEAAGLSSSWWPQTTAWLR